MCNIPLGERRQPYGHDALVAGPVHEYEVSPDYLTSPDEHPLQDFFECKYLKPLFLSHTFLRHT